MEAQRQEAQRYNRATESEYTQYLASSPAAAWAEHIRHSEIQELEDFQAIRRVIYGAWIEEEEIADLSTVERADAILPGLGDAVTGDESIHVEMCRDVANDLRGRGYRGLLAPNAAYVGHRTLAVFGARSEHLLDDVPTSGLGWSRSSRIQTTALARGRPAFDSILSQVRRLGDPYPGPDHAERREK